MLIYNTGFWSTGDYFIAKDLVGILLYDTRSQSAADLFLKNRVSMMSDKIGSWSAGDFIPKEPASMLIYM